MSLLDDHQFVNRMQTKGLKIATDAPSKMSRVPSIDIARVAVRVLTDELCNELRALYYPNSTDQEIKYQVIGMCLRHNMSGEGDMANTFRDNVRYKFMYGEEKEAVAMLISRHGIIK